MSLNEKDPGLTVLTIERPHAARQPSNRSDVLPTIEDVESTHSLTPSATRQNDDRDASPFSPFYSHSATRLSMDAQKSESKQHIAGYDTDVEAGLLRSKNKVNFSTSALTIKSTNDCSVWPGQRALLEKKKALKRRRGFNPLGRLDSRTRLWIKILIGCIVIGAAVGLGLGISKATGGAIWKNNNTTEAPA